MKLKILVQEATILEAKRNVFVWHDIILELVETPMHDIFDSSMDKKPTEIKSKRKYVVKYLLMIFLGSITISLVSVSM